MQEFNIEKAWAQQLIKEMEEILYFYKLKLNLPQIEITNHTSYLGNWHPGLKRIRLSRDLILKYNWDTVIQVLKHEMAHQIAHEFFNEPEEAHGPIFRKACDLIGVAEEFRSATGDIPEGFVNWKDQHQKQQPLLRKIKKLLALASSDNENEAMLAMERVKEICHKHNLQMLQEDQQDNLVYEIINTGKKRVENHQYKICSLLIEHFMVKVVYSNLYDPQTLETHKTIELFGTPANVQMASYVYHFLSKKVLELWQSYKCRERLANRYKRSYLIGLLEGLDEKLCLTKEVHSSKENAPSTVARSLMVREEHRINEFIGQRYPRLHSTRRKSGNIYSDAFYQGTNDGRNIEINRPIEKSPTSFGGYLK